MTPTEIVHRAEILAAEVEAWAEAVMLVKAEQTEPALTMEGRLLRAAFILEARYRTKLKELNDYKMAVARGEVR